MQLFSVRVLWQNRPSNAGVWMAIQWKKPIEPRLIYLLAAASVVVLVLGIIFRPGERPAAPAGSETQTAQLQQRILRSAVEQPGNYLQRLADTHQASLAYAPDLRSTVVILDEQGWAVASAARLPAEPSVVLYRRALPALSARIVAGDALHGLYLLKLEGPEGSLPVVPDNNPARLIPGDQLLALGLDNAMELFLVGGHLTRPLRPGDDTVSFSGNLPSESLGALFLTLDETVVGFCVRDREGVRLRTWAYVSDIVQQLRRNGTHEHPGLGLQAHDRSGLERTQLDLPPLGVVIGRLVTASPAEREGVRPGDLLLELNGNGLRTTEEFYRRVDGLQIGSTATLLIWRDGSEQEVSLQVESVEEMSRRAAGAEVLSGWGMYLARSGGDFRVVEVEPWSRAARGGLQAGDLVASVDGYRFRSVARLGRYLSTRQEPAMGRIVRGDEVRMLRLPPPEEP